MEDETNLRTAADQCTCNCSIDWDAELEPAWWIWAPLTGIAIAIAWVALWFGIGFFVGHSC